MAAGTLPGPTSACSHHPHSQTRVPASHTHVQSQECAVHHTHTQTPGPALTAAPGTPSQRLTTSGTRIATPDYETSHTQSLRFTSRHARANVLAPAVSLPLYAPPPLPGDDGPAHQALGAVSAGPRGPWALWNPLRVPPAA